MEWYGKTIKEIKEQVEQMDLRAYEEILPDLKEDPRSAVQKLAQRLEQRLESEERERQRLLQMKSMEVRWMEEGYSVIAGMDEVGRGPLAGPVVSCALILPRNSMIFKVNDSKKLSAPVRESLYDQILKESLAVGIGRIDNEEIDAINILKATKKSMRMALKELAMEPDLVLVDAVELDGLPYPQRSIIQGDARCYSIAAASIVAKVYRDRLMALYHQEYPQYHFDGNKGYGSKEHVEAIQKYGLTPLHRRSFCKNFL